MGKEFYTAVENSCKDKELSIKAGEGQDVKEVSGRMTKFSCRDQSVKQSAALKSSQNGPRMLLLVKG